MNEEQLIAKLLKVLEENILPLTKTEVKRGNKIFGAAILKKSDLNLVVAGTNQETLNKLNYIIHFGTVKYPVLTVIGLYQKTRECPLKNVFFFLHTNLVL